MTVNCECQAVEQLSVLVVDDESSIRKTLEGVFSDEGFRTKSVSDGPSAIEALQTFNPSVILLDIWMPGMDGIEVLQQVKKIKPSTPVVMISGHATVSTAVKATRMGAFDFIEKPLDLGAMMAVVKRALDSGLENTASGETPLPDDVSGAGTIFNPGRAFDVNCLKRVVFESQKFEPLAVRGKKVVQRTLKKSSVLYGQGLHSGRKSGLILEPLPADSGIHFVGISQELAVPAHVDFVERTGFATTLQMGDTQAGTTEHLMSALHAYGISNLLIKCDGEVPVMDGSAREFCNLFDAIGTEEQSGEWYEIRINQTLEVKGKGQEFIRIEPSDVFSIDYTLDYPEPVGRQHYVYTAGDPSVFKREIAPARTFGFVKDISQLQKAGLALGGRFDNFVLIGEDGVVNGSMRFADEPVRHKVLDAIGDLYLLGRKLAGKITAKMSGHSDNIALLRKIRELIGPVS